MDSIEKFYVPMLCYIDDNRMDIGGNVYPKRGLIFASNFSNDIDIEKGLYGILWGETKTLFYEKIKIGSWVVVKVENNQNLIPVNKSYNRYKFKRGMIIYSGSLCGAGEFIWKVKDIPYHSFGKRKFLIKREDILGTKPWMQKNKKKILMSEENTIFKK